MEPIYGSKSHQIYSSGMVYLKGLKNLTMLTSPSGPHLLQQTAILFKKNAPSLHNWSPNPTSKNKAKTELSKMNHLGIGWNWLILDLRSGAGR